MCIYCGTQYYRKIYKEHYGPIPKDDCGRSYEIHHIDGNHNNNNPNNLVAVTIQEHYDIHYSQGDYAACLFIAQYRLNHTPEELSELARLNVNKRIQNGNHSWLGGEIQKRTQQKLVTEGRHHLLSGEIQKRHNAKLLSEGKHQFQRKGKDHHRYKKEVITLKHKTTGKIISGTIQELINSDYGFNHGNLYRLTSGKRKSNYGWVLYNKE